jgi:hypothetical protein
MTPDSTFIQSQGQTLVEVPLGDGSLVKVPQWKANGGLYGAVVAQAARALGYNNVDATNCHIKKWQSI